MFPGDYPGSYPGATAAEAPGSWWGYLSAFMREGEEEAPVLACPRCGEPYRTDPFGALVCPFDGYRPAGPQTQHLPASGPWAVLAQIRDDNRRPVPVPAPDDPPGWGPSA